MRKILMLAGIILWITACKQEKKRDVEALSTPEAETVEAEWVTLTDVSQWRGYNLDSLPSNWSIKDGIIECYGKAGDVGGDIISTEQYDNFELSLEWKISKGGNSGIFYHVVEDTIYHSPYQTGPEYQLLDDEGSEEPAEDWQKAGANYAMHETNEKKSLNPVGEWNTSKIIFDNGKVEHWLNGQKIVVFDKFSEDWKLKRNSGKWNDYPDYGKSNVGYLALQDHGAGVWFRNVRVRRL
ncbi:3-keto-disaccharide hydrolase [Spongiimicrobium sp. 2-473A-2-J]|uniref:3-keto-disaccharide hydrolase n=1 Tax=Eudoraea algarum TaxID=3417568 RepID=UPI003D35CA76